MLAVPCRSVFERLQGLGVQADMLCVQYRMHPGISDFPSRWFYRDALVTGIDEAERPDPAGIEWPAPRQVRYHEGDNGAAPTPAWTRMPVVLVEAETCEERGDKRSRGDDGVSYANDGEAELAVAAAYALAAGGDVESVGILAPYRAQVCSAFDRLPASVELAALPGSFCRFLPCF